MSHYGPKRGPSFKPTYRQQLLAAKAGNDFYADMAGKPRLDDSHIPPAPVPRKPRDKGETLDRPLEATVIRAVEELLAVHPFIAFALRMNAGAASFEAKSGKFAPVFFHRWVRGAGYRMSDFMGATRDFRVLALECKRPGFRAPSDQREREQANFLACVRSNGGRAGFVTSADEALMIIEGPYAIGA